MEPEGSLPHSQVPATCPYPEPTKCVFSWFSLKEEHEMDGFQGKVWRLIECNTGRVFLKVVTDLFIYLLTYLLTPWSRVLLEKLTGSQLVKKFPAFYAT